MAGVVGGGDLEGLEFVEVHEGVAGPGEGGIGGFAAFKEGKFAEGGAVGTGLALGVEFIDGFDLADDFPGLAHDLGVTEELAVPAEHFGGFGLFAVFGVLGGLPFGGEHGDDGGGFEDKVVTHGGEFLLFEVEAELALGDLLAGLDFVFVVVAEESLGSDGDLTAAEVVEEVLGDVSTFGPSAGTAAVAMGGFNELLAVDIDDVTAPRADMVAVIDAEAVAVAILEGRNLKLSFEQEDFIFPEGVDGCPPVAGRAGAGCRAFVDWTGGEFAHVVAEGALSLLHRYKAVWVHPFLQALGEGDFAVAGDKLVVRNLLGGNGVEAVVIPIGVTEVHEHLPFIA